MNKQIIEEAAAWFVEFNTGNLQHPRARQRFDRWLRTSPEHVRAYLALIPTWEEAALVDTPDSMSVDDIVAWARAGQNVVSIPAAQVQPGRGVLKTRWPPRPLRVVVCAVVLCAIAVLAFRWFVNPGPVYTTQVGEQRSITLADGSIVELNAKSRVRVRYSATKRIVDLEDGQALFQVAKDPRRPFLVQSIDARIRALGTEFDVYKRDTGTTVTVLEGRIAVSASTKDGAPAQVPITDSHENEQTAPLTSAPSEFLLDVGEQVTVDRQSVPKPMRTDVRAATAWTQRELVFNKVPLRLVAEEFNRYSRRLLVVDDPVVQKIVISGVFSSTDPTSLLRFLHAQPDLDVVESADAIHVTEKNSGNR